MKSPLQITPFSIQIEAGILSDLRERIRKTRWPDQAPGTAWEQGTDLEYLRQLLRIVATRRLSQALLGPWRSVAL
jgi:hypothetical protein